MTRKRGFTLIELMLAVSLTAMLVGAVTAVYAYTIERMGYSLASYTTQREAEYGLDVVDHIIATSQTCAPVTVSGNPCLKCILPATCSDPIGDKVSYVCTPNAITRRGLERWGNGKRVWFYLADATGSPTAPGSILWMATRNDDSTPTSANTVKAFTYYPGNSRVRLDLIQSFTTTSGPRSNQDQFTIAVGSYTRSDTAAPNTAASATSMQPSLSRTTYQRGWRF